MYISAVIPTKNRAGDLLNAVKSVIEQSRVPNELIIIDQSETDVSRNLIKALLSGNAGIELRYVYDTNISGLVDAKRVAVNESGGDIICFLEDDVVLESSYIYETELLFLNSPKMMGCCGVTTNLPPLNKNYVFLFHLFHKGIFHDQRVGVHGFSAKTPAELIQSRYLSGGISSYRKEVFDRVFYDLKNDFFMLEDIDFSSRAADCFGASHFCINPNAKLAHYMSPINRAVFEKKYTRKLREFIVFYKKNKYKPRAEFDLLLLLVGLLLEAFFMAFKQRKVAPIVGYFKGLLIGFKWNINKGFQ